MELLKDFDINKIIISDDFKKTVPGEKKMARAEKRYLSTGELPASIVINDDNVLIDGYTTYLVAQAHNIGRISVYRGHSEVIEAVHYTKGDRRFMWRVPMHLVGTIKENDYVIVMTSKGTKRVKVTKVMVQQYPEQTQRLKRVIKVWNR